MYRSASSPFTLFLSVLCLVATPAFAHKSHVHGVGKLEVVVDGEHLRLRLESPLDNLLGFERAPRDDKERAAVRDMTAKLRQGDRLFVPTAAARCRLAEVAIESRVLDPVLLSDVGVTARPAPRGAPQEGDDGHADLVAQYRFVCDRPAALTGMQVRLADTFKGLRRIDAQVAAPGRQSAARLTTRARALSW